MCGLQQIEQRGKEVLSLLLGDGGDALALVPPQVFPRDAGRDDILKTDEE